MGVLLEEGNKITFMGFGLTRKGAPLQEIYSKIYQLILMVFLKPTHIQFFLSIPFRGCVSYEKTSKIP